jgi:hypothetical protein
MFFSFQVTEFNNETLHKIHPDVVFNPDALLPTFQRYTIDGQDGYWKRLRVRVFYAALCSLFLFSFSLIFSSSSSSSSSAFLSFSSRSEF